MEPRQSSSEKLPTIPSSPEVNSADQETGEVGQPSLEGGFDGQRSEQSERRLGHQVEAATQVPPQSFPAVSLPAPVDDNAAADPAIASDDTPIVAADEDLIEKEWVDKAKKVIASTKNDPYRREIEVKKLQLEYVKKRYGKIIGDSGDE